MQVLIVTNDNETGDWVVVFFEGNKIFEGHSIGNGDLIRILEQCVGHETVHRIDMGDDEMNEWLERNED